MSHYSGGKQVQNPNVQNVFLKRQLEEQEKQIQALLEENEQLKRSKRKAEDDLQRGQRITGKKGRKIGKLKALRGAVKIPERPVVVLIGDDGTAHGGENIYGDRDMNHLESRLKEWLPILRNESEGPRVLKLLNQAKESIAFALSMFVKLPIFKNADFIFFACSIHGSESNIANKAGQSSSVIQDHNGGFMLLQGTNTNPGIIDIIEYHSHANALRCYLLGTCRESSSRLGIRLTKDCFSFGPTDLCQKKQKEGIYIARACGHHNFACAADQEDALAPWLTEFVHNMEKPGTKLIDALRISERSVWQASSSSEQQQLPETFHAAFNFVDDADGETPVDIIFKRLPNITHIDTSHDTNNVAVRREASNYGNFGGTEVGEDMDLLAVMDSEFDFDNTSGATIDDNMNAVYKKIEKIIGRRKTKQLREGLLTEMDLRGKWIGVKEAKTIAEALKVNTSLKKINLSYNNIGDEGASAIAKGIQENKNCVLEELDLGYNEIKVEGAKSLAEMIKVN
eukprot:g6138.t1